MSTHMDYKHNVLRIVSPNQHPSRDFLLSRISQHTRCGTHLGVCIFFSGYIFEQLTLDIIFLNQLWIQQLSQGTPSKYLTARICYPLALVSELGG